MPSFKVSILEKDGVEYYGPTEYDPEVMLDELGFEKDEATLDAGWSCLGSDLAVNVKLNRVTFNTKFERQEGFIKHSGFIKGSA